ncbi:hypothetical protein ACLOJK_032127 [Asimina triloba]
MRSDGRDEKGATVGESGDLDKQENSSGEESRGGSGPCGESVARYARAVPGPAPAGAASISVVVSRGDQASGISDLKGNGSNSSGGVEREENVEGAAAAAVTPKKGFLSRSGSFHEECRKGKAAYMDAALLTPAMCRNSMVCQQHSEEPLMVLGCQCRGELAKAHRSCIELWFRTRGSNKCEICQQVAVNVPNLESQPSGCFSPLWVAFSILIGGLLLDVLISISLGVSALPVNIIIGVLVVLGLGTALRLALECCHEWSVRRSIQRADPNLNPGYHSAAV